MYTKRLMKEIKNLQKKTLDGISIVEQTSDMSKLVMRIRGADQSLYAGEEYLLQFRFPDSYPMNPPEVMFIGNAIPVHPHIYGNGHLCLNILDVDWSPVLGVESICLSIVSMMSSCPVKERPPDNETYVRNYTGRSPLQTRWAFHDDTV